jgi:hypothetical protein
MMPSQREGSTLRSPEEIKKLVTGDIRKLNRQLLTIARRLDSDARSHRFARRLPGRILTSFYRKIVNTSSAIELLKRQRHIEEAWILLRVLLEAHVNFFYFLKNEPKEMCRQYADASLLDKIKHLRQVDFYRGRPLAALHDKTQWEQEESEIKKRYSTKEFEALRRHGFSGVNFEERARSVGLKNMYEFCYRIASRSVHVFDPAETPIYSAVFKGRGKEKRELLRLRREQLDFNQNMLVGRPSFVMAEIIHSSLASVQLINLGLGYEKYRDRVSGPVGGVSDSADRFYIWRE